MSPRQQQEAQNKNPLPNIATILLDKNAKNVLKTSSWTQAHMQEELKLKKDEKNTIINDGIFFKIVVTEDNKIYMLFSNPVMLR